LGELSIHIQPAAIPLYECIRHGLAKRGLVRIYHVALEFIYNNQRVFASSCGTRYIEREYGGNFFSGSWTIVYPARHVNRCRYNAVAIKSSERFVFGDTLVVTKRLVDNYFRYFVVMRDNGNALKLVVLRLFSVWHGLPLGISPYFSHFIRAGSVAQYLAPI
jgi:hypothetical protein